jgi:hypothetical protein
MLGGSIKPPAFALSTIFDALEFIKLVGGMTAKNGDAADLHLLLGSKTTRVYARISGTNLHATEPARSPERRRWPQHRSTFGL